MVTLKELYKAYKNAYYRNAHAVESAVRQAYLKSLAYDGMVGMSNNSAKAWLYVTENAVRQQQLPR